MEVGKATVSAPCVVGSDAEPCKAVMKLNEMPFIYDRIEYILFLWHVFSSVQAKSSSLVR